MKVTVLLQHDNMDFLCQIVLTSVEFIELTLLLGHQKEISMFFAKFQFIFHISERRLKLLCKTWVYFHQTLKK